MAFSVTIDDNQKFAVIRLQDLSNNTTAEIYTFGALLNCFSVKSGDKTINVIDAFSSPEDALTNITNGFKSARLSPFVCRMHEGRYTFAGTQYEVEKFKLGPHAIHGIIYDAVYDIKDTWAEDKGASVTLEYNYKGTDKGYPFNYNSLVVWQLAENNALTVTTTVANEHNQPIPFSDGWHPYFKVAATVDECYLQFNSDTMMEFDDTLLPTGKRLPDGRFVKPASLKDLFLDNCFELHQNSSEPACILRGSEVGLNIFPDAAYPFLQVYTPPHRESIAIENLSSVPDAFNNKTGLLELQPGQRKTFSTTYQLALS